MFCSKCGTKIDDDSKFCKVCGAAQTAEIQKKQTVLEVCQILQASRRTRRTYLLLGGERGDVWYEARKGDQVICTSQVLHNVDGLEIGSPGRLPMWLPDNQDGVLRQQVVDTLLDNGWRPSAYDEQGNITAMEREKP